MRRSFCQVTDRHGSLSLTHCVLLFPHALCFILSIISYPIVSVFISSSPRLCQRYHDLHFRIRTITQRSQIRPSRPSINTIPSDRHGSDGTQFSGNELLGVSETETQTELQEDLAFARRSSAFLSPSSSLFHTRFVSLLSHTFCLTHRFLSQHK